MNLIVFVFISMMLLIASSTIQNSTFAVRDLQDSKLDRNIENEIAKEAQSNLQQSKDFDSKTSDLLENHKDLVKGIKDNIFR
jgi:hypothetical protein